MHHDHGSYERTCSISEPEELEARWEVGDTDEFDPRKGLLSNYDFWINYMSDYSYELFDQIIPKHFGKGAEDYASAIEEALKISAEQVHEICINGGVDSFFDDNPELLAEILE